MPVLKLHSLCLAALCGLLLVGVPCMAAAQVVGSVTRVQNQAQVGSTPAVSGTPVSMNQVIRTGPGARLRITFRDGTSLTLGENARIVVNRYVYNPASSTGVLALNASRGAFSVCNREDRLNDQQESYGQNTHGNSWCAGNGVLVGKGSRLQHTQRSVAFQDGQSGCTQSGRKRHPFKARGRHRPSRLKRELTVSRHKRGRSIAFDPKKSRQATAHENSLHVCSGGLGDRPGFGRGGFGP